MGTNQFSIKIISYCVDNHHPTCYVMRVHVFSSLTGFVPISSREHELANKSFQEAQNHDPSYLRGWVGQALLAETTGYDSEAMDLFRHACFLGNEPEASIGYANWVCK